MTLFGHNITSYCFFFSYWYFLLHIYCLLLHPVSTCTHWVGVATKSKVPLGMNKVFWLWFWWSRTLRSIQLCVWLLYVLIVFHYSAPHQLWKYTLDLKTYQLPMHLYRVQQPNRHFSTKSHYTEYINWHYLWIFSVWWSLWVSPVLCKQ